MASIGKATYAVDERPAHPQHSREGCDSTQGRLVRAQSPKQPSDRQAGAPDRSRPVCNSQTGQLLYLRLSQDGVICGHCRKGVVWYVTSWHKGQVASEGACASIREYVQAPSDAT